jgi:hypothetical protein
MRTNKVTLSLTWIYCHFFVGETHTQGKREIEREREREREREKE